MLPKVGQALPLGRSPANRAERGASHTPSLRPQPLPESLP
jgi:hypothetical protein